MTSIIDNLFDCDLSAPVKEATSFLVLRVPGRGSLWVHAIRDSTGDNMETDHKKYSQRNHFEVLLLKQREETNACIGSACARRGILNAAIEIYTRGYLCCRRSSCSPHHMAFLVVHKV